MRRRESTPGQRARLYLEMHQATRMTGLPDEHRAAREDVMRQLEREDPGVRERAMVGANQHFDRPLSKGEREHQAYWQREERLDHGDVLQRRRELEPRPPRAGEHEGRRRRQPTAPGAPRRPSPTRPIRKAANAVTSSAAAVAPPPVTKTGTLLLNALAAGVGLAMLDLLLTNGKTIGNLVGGATKIFGRVVSPVPLFGAAAPSSSGGATSTGVALGPLAPNPAAVGAAVAARNAGLNLNQYLQSPFTEAFAAPGQQVATTGGGSTPAQTAAGQGLHLVRTASGQYEYAP